MRCAARGARRFAFRSLALALALAASGSTGTGTARAQEPPPPPTNVAPQYVPPPTPQGSQGPAPGPTPRREPPKREREREREREHEREREREPAPPPPRRVAPAPPASSRDEAPPASTGFQLGLRAGLSIPVGDISGTKGDSMSHDFALQVPLFLEIGVKVHPMVFLGAYTALAFGGTSSAFSTAQGCGNGGRSCLASTLRIGVEVQVHFQPAERMDPWVGYGIGLESASASANGGGVPEASESLTGIEFARLAAGLDFRLSRLFGIGPYLEIPMGTYSHAHVQGYQGQALVPADSGIDNSSLHAWPTLGVRGVFFP